MADFIDLQEFKDVLGIPTGLYDDPVLQEVIDASCNIIDRYLTYKAVPISAAEFDHPSSTATYWTTAPVPFSVGESVTLDTYFGAPFTGTQTVTTVGTYTFQTSKSHATSHTKTTLIPNGRAITNSQATLYDAVPEIREAALLVAVDIWSARQSPAGQAQGVDFQPGPYRMGRSILSRVIGLIGRHRDVEGMVG